MDDRDSIPGKIRAFFLFATAFRPVVGPPNLLSSVYRG
jgi:hypothetical protein